jgi:hypothetical protein
VSSARSQLGSGTLQSYTIVPIDKHPTADYTEITKQEYGRAADFIKRGRDRGEHGVGFQLAMS